MGRSNQDKPKGIAKPQKSGKATKTQAKLTTTAPSGGSPTNPPAQTKPSAGSARADAQKKPPVAISLESHHKREQDFWDKIHSATTEAARKANRRDRPRANLRVVQTLTHDLRRAAKTDGRPLSRLVQVFDESLQDRTVWLACIASPGEYASRLPAGDTAIPVMLWRDVAEVDCSGMVTNASNEAFVHACADGWFSDALFGFTNAGQLHANGAVGAGGYPVSSGAATNSAYAGAGGASPNAFPGADGVPPAAPSTAWGSMVVPDVAEEFTSNAYVGTQYIQVGSSLELSMVRTSNVGGQASGWVMAVETADPGDYPIQGRTAGSIMDDANEEGSPYSVRLYDIMADGQFVRKGDGILRPDTQNIYDAHEDADVFGYLSAYTAPVTQAAYDWNRIGTTDLSTGSPGNSTMGFYVWSPSGSAFETRQVSVYQTEMYPNKRVAQSIIKGLNAGAQAAGQALGGLYPSHGFGVPAVSRAAAKLARGAISAVESQRSGKGAAKHPTTKSALKQHYDLSGDPDMAEAIMASLGINARKGRTLVGVHFPRATSGSSTSGNAEGRLSDALVAQGHIAAGKSLDVTDADRREIAGYTKELQAGRRVFQAAMPATTTDQLRLTAAHLNRAKAQAAMSGNVSTLFTHKCVAAISAMHENESLGYILRTSPPGSMGSLFAPHEEIAFRHMMAQADASPSADGSSVSDWISWGEGILEKILKGLGMAAPLLAMI